MNRLVEKIRGGDRKSLARAMSLVEETSRESNTLRDLLRLSTGDVPWWGFTGPPGVGKSTLIDALIGRLRSAGSRIGVVAVDPTSPLSDGALLGDRVRMMQHATDLDVFIRSLATHRREGGLSDATLHCARLLELAGYDPVMIETVGVGQNEVDISNVADFCTVILAPGYGDDIQLIKAGLLEIADLVVVNKCDLPDAKSLLQAVHAELALSSPSGDAPTGTSGTQRTPHAKTQPVEILGIEAKSGTGVDELLDKLRERDRIARTSDRRQAKSCQRLSGEIRHGAAVIMERALEGSLTSRSASELMDRVERGELPLDSAAIQLVVDGVKEWYATVDETPALPDNAPKQPSGDEPSADSRAPKTDD